MKYLEIFEIIIIYKVCSVYNICDTVTLALEIIPNADIPFCTPRTPTFLRELYLYNIFFFVWNMSTSSFMKLAILWQITEEYRTKHRDMPFITLWNMWPDTLCAYTDLIWASTTSYYYMTGIMIWVDEELDL